MSDSKLPPRPDGWSLVTGRDGNQILVNEGPRGCWFHVSDYDRCHDALRLALEETATKQAEWNALYHEAVDRAEAAEAKLAAKQEPVAWTWIEDGVMHEPSTVRFASAYDVHPIRATPLYASPVPATEPDARWRVERHEDGAAVRFEKGRGGLWLSAGTDSGEAFLALLAGRDSVTLHVHVVERDGREVCK